MDKKLNQPLITRTPEQLVALREYAASQDLPLDIYENFATFAHYMVPTIGEEQFAWEWFHYYICDMYNNVIFKGTKLFTIELPPQVGKSLLTSLFIVYCFGINPDLNIIYVTYNEAKAVDFTKKYVIHQLGTDKFAKIFPFVVTKNMLDKKDNSKKGSFQKKTATFSDNSFTLSCPITTMQKNYRGGYKCFGMEQGIHGSPANIFLIDDYVSEASDVQSEAFRTQRRNWFFTDMASRLQGNNSVVGAICTRWYYDDIVGLLEMTYKNQTIPLFEKYNLTPPELNQVKVRFNYRVNDNNPPCDPRKEEGEILWIDHLLKISFLMGSPFYDAMCNCDPASTDGKAQLKPSDFYYYQPHELPTTYALDIMIDGASTTGSRSDKTAIGIFRRSGRYKYLVKLYYVKKSIPDLLMFVIDIITLEYPNYSDLIIEYADSGRSLSQFLDELQFRNIKLNFSSRPVGEVKSKFDKLGITSKGTSKTDRFYRAVPVILHADKPIRLPLIPIEHQDVFIDQICKFTGEQKGKADDMVDMLSHYINYTESSTIRVSDFRATVAIDGYTGEHQYFEGMH